MNKTALREKSDQMLADASLAWGEPARYRYIKRARLQFRGVPGRRLDGTEKGKQLIRRFGWNLLRVLGRTVTFFVPKTINDLTDSHPQSSETTWGLLTPNAFVTGPPVRTGTLGSTSAGALGLADAMRAAKRSLWIVGSEHHLALYQAHRDEPIRLLWYATGLERPVNRKGFTVITWPDGSSLRFGKEEQITQSLAKADDRTR